MFCVLISLLVDISADVFELVKPFGSLADYVSDGFPFSTGTSRPREARKKASTSSRALFAHICLKLDSLVSHLPRL